MSHVCLMYVSCICFIYVLCVSYVCLMYVSCMSRVPCARPTHPSLCLMFQENMSRFPNNSKLMLIPMKQAYMWFKLLQLRAIKLLHHHHHHHDHQLRLGCCNVVAGAPLYIWWQLVWYQGCSRWRVWGAGQVVGHSCPGWKMFLVHACCSQVKAMLKIR